MRIPILCELSVAVALTLLVAGCDGTEATSMAGGGEDRATASAGSRKAYALYEVTGKEYVEAIDLPGASVHGYETTRIMAKLGGYVGEIMKVDGQEIDIGSVVAKGAVLARLDIPEMKSELEQKQALLEQARSEVTQAEAAVAQAEAEVLRRKAEVAEAQAMKKEKLALQQLRRTAFKRVAGLVKERAVTTDNLDEARFALDAADAAVLSVDATVQKAESFVTVAREMVKKSKADKKRAEAHVKVAEADLATARAMDAYSRITAPFDGMITERLVDHGAFVRPATSNSGAMALFEITRTDRMRVEVAVPNVKTARIGVGNEAMFHNIGGLPGAQVRGRVERTATALDHKTRTMRIHVGFDGPLQNESTGKTIRLEPGMYGSIRVILKRWEQIPVVPAAALAVDETGQSYVMAVDDSGVCRRRIVEVAFNDAKEAGLGSGVEIGEKVVAANVESVSDGESISTK